MAHKDPCYMSVWLSGISSCLPVCCPSISFCRPLLLLPEMSSRTDFAQMWLCSRLKQWPNHFSLLFSRKVSTGFMCASFLMSSFLMWSNLVFPLAHLNILISAEFNLPSSLMPDLCLIIVNVIDDLCLIMANVHA